MKLLTRSQSKMEKSLRLGYVSYILHLAPHRMSGYQTCPKAQTCQTACLNTAGRGRFTKTQAARIRKTKWFFEDRESFMGALYKDVESAIRYAKKRGLTLTVRPNGTSDIPWEKIRVKGFRNIFEAFPDVIFYDYTKIAGRKTPDNYHLTFSYDGINSDYCRFELERGRNVAAVFESLPVEYMGKPVIDGDAHDLRFLDAPGVIVGLKPKGLAKKDYGPFVIRSV